MKKIVPIFAIVCFVFLSAAAQAVRADSSVTLESANNGVFLYGLTSTVTILAGQGVTSTSVVGNVGNCMVASSFTSSSATFVDGNGFTSCTTPPPFTSNEGFVVDSSVHNLGSVNWTLQISVAPGVGEILTGTTTRSRRRQFCSGALRLSSSGLGLARFHPTAQQALSEICREIGANDAT
jgi:hypothetical protein